MDHRTRSSSGFSATPQSHPRPRKSQSWAVDGSCGSSTPGGISTSTRGGMSSSSSQHGCSTDHPLLKAATTQMIVRVSLGQSNAAKDDDDDSDILGPRLLFRSSQFAPSSELSFEGGAQGCSTSRRGSLSIAARPPPSPPSSQQLGSSPHARLSIKTLEARQTYQLRLLRQWERRRVAAVATIWRVYRDRKQRRVQRDQCRLSREAAIEGNIAAHRRATAVRRFKALVLRHTHLLRGPTQLHRWICLQSLVRGLLARRIFCRMRVCAAEQRVKSHADCLERRAAVTIQSQWRRLLSNRHSGIDAITFLKVRRRHAVRVIQFYTRWYVFRRPCAARRQEHTALRHKRAAVLIQQRWRKWRLQGGRRSAGFCSSHHLLS